MLDVKWLIKTLMMMKEVEIGQLLAMEERGYEQVGGRGGGRKGAYLWRRNLPENIMHEKLAGRAEIFGIWVENDVVA